MLSIVTFKWKKPGYRSTFTGHHVNVMAAMADRHYPDPHRHICVTDDPTGIDPRIECVPLWNDHADLLNPSWPTVGPSCFRRLRVFSKEFEQIAGERFVCIDLDAVIVDDMRPLWNRTEDFVMYASVHARYALNGSMFMMTAGSRPQVWDDFEPIESPKLTKQAGITGSDQAWIQYCLGKDAATWTDKDGVYAWRQDCMKRPRGMFPTNSKLIVFHGKPDPWDPEAIARSPWIKQHYK